MMVYIVNDDDDVVTMVGLVHIFSKSGRGVSTEWVSSSADLLIQSHDTQKSMSFMLVRCRAWDWVPESVRPSCFSLMDASRPGWYVRHGYYVLYLVPENETDNLYIFQRDSSFTLHVDTFYPGYYALQFVKFFNYYARLLYDGYLKIEINEYTSAYMDATSFRLYEYNKSRTYQILEGLGRRRKPEQTW